MRMDKKIDKEVHKWKKKWTGWRSERKQAFPLEMWLTDWMMHQEDMLDRPHFFLFVSLSQFSFPFIMNTRAVDWHSVWDQHCLFFFAAEPISSTNDLYGSSQMMEKISLSLSKLKESPLTEIAVASSTILISYRWISLHHIEQILSSLSAFHLSVTISLPSLSPPSPSLFPSTLTSPFISILFIYVEAVDTLFENRD